MPSVFGCPATWSSNVRCLAFLAKVTTASYLLGWRLRQAWIMGVTDPLLMEEPSSMATFSRVSRLSCRSCGRGACGRGATLRRRPFGSATLGAKPSTLRMAAAISGARCMVECQCLQVQHSGEGWS